MLCGRRRTSRGGESFESRASNQITTTTTATATTGRVRAARVWCLVGGPVAVVDLNFIITSLGEAPGAAQPCQLRLSATQIERSHWDEFNFFLFFFFFSRCGPTKHQPTIQDMQICAPRTSLGAPAATKKTTSCRNLINNKRKWPPSRVTGPAWAFPRRRAGSRQATLFG